MPARRSWWAYASPPRAAQLAAMLAPAFGWAALALAIPGLIIGFLLAPPDAQQGQVYRIIFLHVPTAWMSMLAYLALAFWSLLHLSIGTRLSALMARALAPTGALMTLLALITGSIWGKPTWGTWWVWDARLTSELLLLFLYLGYMALHDAIDDAHKAERAASLLALVGVINLPLIYFSVIWWNTLHQGASVSFDAAPRMAGIMLAGMLLMSAAAWCYTVWAALQRLRCLVAEASVREGEARHG